MSLSKASNDGQSSVAEKLLDLAKQKAQTMREILEERYGVPEEQESEEDRFQRIMETDAAWDKWS